MNRGSFINNDKETSVWNHYADYLAEAMQRDRENLREAVDHIKNCIAEGCDLKYLKSLMLSVFEPGTIMQALEQWQNQMDLMLHTGLKKFNGKSRYDYYAGKKDSLPYDFMGDDTIDDPGPLTHIYDLSGVTQAVIHMAFEYGGKEAPALIAYTQKKAHLEENYELQMLLGDAYRQIGQFKEAIQIYEELWEKNGHLEFSIQDAILFTRFLMQNSSGIKGKQIEEWIDDFHVFKKQETVRKVSPKISRNDPCPCGSGKKYKFCCGRV